MNTVESVMADVRTILAETLGVEESEATPDANFYYDLGGESIDVLDLSFRLEKQFQIKPRFQQLSNAEQLTTDEHGRLTPSALAWLQVQAPYLDYTRLKPNATVDDLRDLFTVAAITRFVLQTLHIPESDAA